MRAAALRVELHLPGPQSLKAKRAILRPVVEGIKRLGSFSVAEVDHHDSWQRAALGVAVAARDGESLAMQIAKLRRYLDTRLEVEVLDIHISEMEDPV
jgi:hypothetical protein